MPQAINDQGLVGVEPSVATAAGSNGNGSTNTLIRRWDTLTDNSADGGVLTWTDSAADGAYVTVLNKGIYAVSVTFKSENATVADALGINAAAALTNLFDGSHLQTRQDYDVALDSLLISWVGELQANDLIWISTKAANASSSATTEYYQVSITKFGKYTYGP